MLRQHTHHAIVLLHHLSSLKLYVALSHKPRRKPIESPIALSLDVIAAAEVRELVGQRRSPETGADRAVGAPLLTLLGTASSRATLVVSRRFRISRRFSRRRRFEHRCGGIFLVWPPILQPVSEEVDSKLDGAHARPQPLPHPGHGGRYLAAFEAAKPRQDRGDQTTWRPDHLEPSGHELRFGTPLTESTRTASGAAPIKLFGH